MRILSNIRRSFLVRAVVCSIVIGTTAACPAPNVITGTSSQIDGSMTAAINGDSFKAVAGSAERKGALWVFSGADNFGVLTARSITFFVQGEPRVGSVALSPGSSASAQQIEGFSIWGTDATGSSGSLNITEVSATRVKGTFSFIAKSDGSSSTRVITNGKFDLAFTK